MRGKFLILITVACLVVIATGAVMALFVRGGLLHTEPVALHDLLHGREPTIWPTVGWSVAGLGAAGLGGVIAAKIAQGSIGDLLPKRRWFQFSLRAMLIVMTLTGVSLGWWKSYRHCVDKSVEHHTEGCWLWLSGHFVSVGEIGEELQKERNEHSRSCNRRRKYHEQLEAAYKSAAWRPWERFWIDDTPPDDIR